MAALIVAGSLAFAITVPAQASAAAAAAAPNKKQVERLYVEGQTRDEAKDYTGASESWTRLLRLLPENDDNKALRENVIINVLDAHIKAYEGVLRDDGTKEIKHLRDGKATSDKYKQDFKAFHGERVAVSGAVLDKARELEEKLAAAEEEEKAKGAAAPDVPPDPGQPANPDPRPRPGPKPEIDRPEPQNNGLGLIIGGSVVAALGVGAIAMIGIGSVRGKTAEQDFMDAQDAEEAAQQANDQTAENDARLDKERADFDGKQANAILISGAVLAPLLLAGGATMIAFGILNRRSYNEPRQAGARVTPVLSPRFAGFAIQGRF